jgi:thymidylate synthase (FAD)
MSQSELESLLQNVEHSLASKREKQIFLDRPRVHFIGADPLIEQLAKEYIETKYNYLLKDAKIHADVRLDPDKYMQYLANMAIDHQDFSVFKAGHAHFRLNLSRVSTNDLIRHQSLRFKQTGQTKQLDLFIDFPDEDVAPDTLKFYLPPDWHKARELAAEFNSAMVYVSNLARRAKAAGLSGNQSKYVIPNCATTDLRISGSLGDVWNLVGLRSCGREQFENNYHSRRIAKILKDVLPNLTHKLGPRCVYEGHCREGKGTCGRQKEMTTEFLGDATNLTASVKDFEHRMDLVDKLGLEYNDSLFIENYQKAYHEYLDMRDKKTLPVVEPRIKFRAAIPDLERLHTENARNTYIRLTGDKFASDDDIQPGEIEKTLKFVTKANHPGVIDEQEVTYDTKISRVMLQKFARHSSLKLMASSQHHSLHTNFEYIMPPEWAQFGMDVEFHVWNRYLDGLYSRALAAGLVRDQARYCLPTDATTNLRPSASIREWYSIAKQRTCPSNGWEERTVVTAIVMDLKSKFPNDAYYMGPPCLTGMCQYKCSKEDEVKKTFLK